MLAKTNPSQDCLIIAPYYAPERIGSAPYCAEVAEWLAARGLAVTVLATRPHYPSAADFPEYADGARDRENLNGVAVIRVEPAGADGAGAAARLKRDVGFCWRAFRAARGAQLPARNQAIVAFVPSLFTLFLGRALRRPGGRVIAVVHDIESGLAKALGMVNGAFLVRCLEWLERLALNRADEIIVLTRQMALELRRNGVRPPITVLPIWSGATPTAETDAGPSGPLRVLYAGNFGRKQGVDQLIDLAALLATAHPGVIVTLQGDGSERPRLEAEVARRGLTNVEFRGLVPRAMLQECLRAAEIHLVPQDPRAANYALPSKVTSIMAAGRAFVCTATGATALAELVATAEAGLAVPPDDAAALFQAVDRLIRDPALRRRLGENGRRYTERELDPASILGRYEAIIRAAAPAGAAALPRQTADQRPAR